MDLVIAIKSCEADRLNGLHSCIRETWSKDAVRFGVDVLFFMGNGARSEYLDEIVLDCDDSYEGLPYKTKEICRWALNQGKEFILIADTDTFFVPGLLLNIDYENYDYLGVTREDLYSTFPHIAKDRKGRKWFIPECYPYCSGGQGYFLSRKAMGYIVEAKPNIWAEDVFVALTLGPLYREGKIKRGHTNLLEEVSSWHYPRMRYNQDSIHEGIKSWQQDLYNYQRESR